jgi:hypothetical protein
MQSDWKREPEVEAVAVPEELELECLSGEQDLVHQSAERGLERRSAVPD